MSLQCTKFTKDFNSTTKLSVIKQQFDDIYKWLQCGTYFLDSDLSHVAIRWPTNTHSELLSYWFAFNTASPISSENRWVLCWVRLYLESIWIWILFRLENHRNCHIFSINFDVLHWYICIAHKNIYFISLPHSFNNPSTARLLANYSINLH